MAATVIGMVLVMIVALAVISIFSEDDDDPDTVMRRPRHRASEDTTLDELLH